MNPTDLESARIAAKSLPAQNTPTRKPFVEPQLTEQGELGEVTAGSFGPMSP